MKLLACVVLAVALSPLWATTPHVPAPVFEYPIHRDGGLIYDPLRREAESTGQLAVYARAGTTPAELGLGRYRLRAEVPARAAAYDVVPIRYTLSWRGEDGSFPVAVQATAFEDESRRRGRHLHDLALPGRIDVRVRYEGSITAHLTPGARHNLTPDFSDTPGCYPGFERRAFARSGVVEAGDLVWFKFRYTNSGNTILDPEGMGGYLICPELHRRNPAGDWELVGRPYNLYVRDLGYLYPGESRETWLHFASYPPGETPQNFGLIPGDYTVKFRIVCRWYKHFDPWVNIWEGAPVFVFEQPIRVEPEAREAPVPEGSVTLTDGGGPDKITRWMHTFEEFMSAFDCHISDPSRGASGAAGKIRGTLHLQVAPWTRQVVIKLITAEPTAIRTVAVPIEVDSDSLRIAFNPRHQMSIVRGGLREPAIWSQSMADMRANVQIGPFPEVHIRERLREMIDCGINVSACTSMPWLYDDRFAPKSNYQGDALKYFLDCARDEGMQVEGWGAYPYDRATIEQISNWITGRGVKMDTYLTTGYAAVSHSDPNLPAANAAAWLYQFRRWRDLYYQAESGAIPIGVEDTRGWMRQDINIRYPMGERSLNAFREWLKAKYGSIEAVNRAWQSAYSSFDDIDPEAGQIVNVFGHKWEFTDRANPFHDWNAAVEDFDTFRSELRVRNYADTLEIVREEIPDAAVLLRTEGANVIVDGIDPQDPNPHHRHICYSQRRCGAIADIIRQSGLVKWHSDYTTLPYTPTELRMLTRRSVEQGIIPIYLPQFDNMRDIAINDRYGADFGVHYNLPSPKKGQIIHVLTALYPWFVATYEEGGVPGILWEDYQCDGFATETQKREMRFFKQKLREALNTPDALRARGEDVGTPPQAWRERSRAMRSYQ